jgi:uncharacterized protein (DUF983 family)
MAATQTLGQIAWRALRCRCPACGEGDLLAGYMRQVEACTYCGERFGHIRADDGPAWLTILIVGHIVVSLILMVEPNVDWPQWLSTAVWLSVSLAAVLAILPRAKCFFIGVIWRSGAPGSETI